MPQLQKEGARKTIPDAIDVQIEGQLVALSTIQLINRPAFMSEFL